MELHDNLTGLYQEKFFRELCYKEVIRSLRYDRPACFLVMEIAYDYFEKELNIRRELGYRVHRELGGAVQSIAREVDFGGRLSGEVLSLVLPETDREGGRQAGERLRSTVAELEIGSGGLVERPIKVALNVGIASFPANGKTAEELLLAAEAAMVTARNEGGNTIRLAQESD